jgi:protein-S-isoprenylcysteine O-methyltransferase Ste14
MMAMFGNFDRYVVCYLVGYAVFVAIRGSEAESTRFGSAFLEKLVMAATGIGVMLLPLLFVVTPWLDRLNYQPHWIIRMLGIAVMVDGLILFWRAHRDLGRNFSRTLEIHTGHQLVTDGVYRFRRHPIYAAIWKIALAQALLLPNWIAGPGGLIGFAAMYFLRLPREEAMMRETFGPAYDAYAFRTGRVFPRLKSPFREGEEV